MATSASNEASDIRRRGRQRLIGAVAIVLLLVVFVPMVLDSEPRPARNEPALNIPPKDNPPPLPAPAAASGLTPAIVAPSPDARGVSEPAAASPEPRKPAAASLEPSKPAAASPEPPKPAAASPEPPKRAGVSLEAAAKPASAPKLDGFAVQVGAFRDDEKLRQAREKLAAAGIAHYTERLESSAGALTRLRAGPFATREAAEAAAAKLRGISLQGQVVSLP
jgi:DedD protein